MLLLVSTGDSQPIDICSVHHNNTFLRYSVSLLGYGFYGDLLTDSEKKRWMGPTRYDFSGKQQQPKSCSPTSLCPHHEPDMGSVSLL